jgi:hypothetical protein
MGMSITKLDGRYAGGNQFHYMVEFLRPYTEKELFCEVREWCWTTWGPSRELKFMDTSVEQVWCFMTDNHRTRIYLKNKKELEWFILRWPECLFRKR